MEDEHQENPSLMFNIREVTALIAASALLAIPIRFGGPQACDQHTPAPPSVSQTATEAPGVQSDGAPRT